MGWWCRFCFLVGVVLAALVGGLVLVVAVEIIIIVVAVDVSGFDGLID